jgi:hypothetical protein
VPFGTPLSTLAAPDKPPTLREPAIYAICGQGRPTSGASSRSPLRDDEDARPARSPLRSSGACVRSYFVRPGSSAAIVPSIGLALLASVPPYHDLDLTPQASFSLSIYFLVASLGNSGKPLDHSP